MFYTIYVQKTGFLLLEATVALLILTLSTAYAALYCWRTQYCYQEITQKNICMNSVQLFFDRSQCTDSDVNCLSKPFIGVCTHLPPISVVGKQLHPIRYVVYQQDTKKECVAIISVMSYEKHTYDHYSESISVD